MTNVSGTEGCIVADMTDDEIDALMRDAKPDHDPEVTERVRARLFPTAKEDRSEPPPGYFVLVDLSAPQGRGFEPDIHAAPQGPGMEGAVAACWAHRDAVLASAGVERLRAENERLKADAEHALSKWREASAEADALRSPALRVGGGPLSGTTRDGEHIIIRDDYNDGRALHLMRHGDGDIGVAVAEGDRWPGFQAMTLCASGSRSPEAWSTLASLFSEAPTPSGGGEPVPPRHVCVPLYEAAKLLVARDWDGFINRTPESGDINYSTVRDAVIAAAPLLDAERGKSPEDIMREARWSWESMPPPGAVLLPAAAASTLRTAAQALEDAYDVGVAEGILDAEDDDGASQALAGQLRALADAIGATPPGEPGGWCDSCGEVPEDIGCLHHRAVPRPETVTISTDPVEPSVSAGVGRLRTWLVEREAAAVGHRDATPSESSGPAARRRARFDARAQAFREVMQQLPAEAPTEGLPEGWDYNESPVSVYMSRSTSDSFEERVWLSDAGYAKAEVFFKDGTRRSTSPNARAVAYLLARKGASDAG